nr:MAG TPA: Nematocyst outer wall antigen evolution, nematocyst, bridge state [Caudoviricetes sp.]
MSHCSGSCYPVQNALKIYSVFVSINSINIQIVILSTIF